MMKMKICNYHFSKYPEKSTLKTESNFNHLDVPRWSIKERFIVYGMHLKYIGVGTCETPEMGLVM
jgi:hypothetical protein